MQLKGVLLLLLVANGEASEDNCADTSTQCSRWASVGECEKNPKYMRASCAKSCGSCPPSLGVTPDNCADYNGQCSHWARSGECKKNSGYMKASCAKSCGACPPPLDKRLIELGDERVVMEIEGFGSVELGFFPHAAPITVKHILRLFRLGCYDTDHIFRVDRGFVAQVQSVQQSDVLKPLSPECRAEASKNVPAEFTAIPHVRGILSMGRRQDPNSGGSSFSMLLGAAPHLNHKYTVFGKVLEGDHVLSALERVQTHKRGIFVMPTVRINIKQAYIAGHHKVHLLESNVQKNDLVVDDELLAAIKRNEI
eukprot:TRINITY_DN96424_c0_g1_i1.p1 TRINITY_DN96424_c0_g1~~TRINITY_DN96424_c0_g1_i1.p1  ORF type:complete len:310 (+),score=38.88 TRINITY_DN96424_c0_g1_i1:83-1012(+)